MYPDAEEPGKKMGELEVLMQDLKPDTTEIGEAWWDSHDKEEIKTGKSSVRIEGDCVLERINKREPELKSF